MIAHVAACAAAALLVIQPALAEHQPPAERAADASNSQAADLRRNEAQQRFQRGLSLARNQSWDAALAEFLASRELYPTRSATRNAAIALERLGRHAEAYELYAALLAEFTASMPPEQRAIIATEMNALLRQVAEINIAVDEPGVLVVVNSQRRGTTPLGAPIRVNPGTHTVRLSKAGLAPFEQTFTLAGGKQKTIEGRLRRLTQLGNLVVRELNGHRLDVVVDAAVVGETPWLGSLAPGAHAVQLRGEGELGTAPRSANVRANQTSTLVLRATRLDAAVRVQPSPSNATLFIDGVPVGTGIWEGRLPSGPHRFEAIAPGHRPFQRLLSLRPHVRERIVARLERDLSTFEQTARFLSPLYAELTGGALLAASLNGDADDCGCEQRARPLGAIGALRVGYALGRGVGVELMGGYLTISESMRREVEARGEADSGSFLSQDYEDSTLLAGPLAALMGSVRAFERFPVTTRAGFGVMALTSSTSNSGTFTTQYRASGNTGETSVYSSQVSIREASRRLYTPFVATELRFGIRFTSNLSADLGLGLLFAFPPRIWRIGTDTAGGENGRGVLLPAKAPATGNAEPVRPGVMRLPDEKIAGMFVALSPAAGVRLDF